MDVGEDTTLGDGHAAEELVELFVVADGELNVAGSDAGLLVVASGVAGELEDLSGEVLHYCSKVDGGATTDTSGVLSLAQVASDTANGELKSSAAAAGLGLARLSFASASFTFSTHTCCCCFAFMMKIEQSSSLYTQQKRIEINRLKRLSLVLVQ